MSTIDDYTYRVFWSSRDREYVATVREFPSLSWLDESRDRALVGLRKVLQMVLEDMASTGETPPAPRPTIWGTVGDRRANSHARRRSARLVDATEKRA